MSNAYYKQTIGEGNSAGTIELTAEDFAPNAISIRMTGFNSALLALNEKDQNDLIAGILERRGHHPEITMKAIKKLRGGVVISPKGNEKSKIHPPKPQI